MSTVIVTKKDLEEMEELLKKLTDLYNKRKIDWVNNIKKEYLIDFLEIRLPGNKNPKPYFDFTFAKLGAEPHEIACFVINVNIGRLFGRLFFSILKETPVCCEYVSSEGDDLFGLYFYDLLNRLNAEDVPGLIRNLITEIEYQEKILTLISH